MIIQIYEVTRPAEAHALGAMGVDHIGVLVGDGSFPREQTIEKAREIFAAIPSGSKAFALSSLRQPRQSIHSAAGRYASNRSSWHKQRRAIISRWADQHGLEPKSHPSNQGNTRQNLSAFTSGHRRACPLSEGTPVTHVDLNRLRFTETPAFVQNDHRGNFSSVNARG